MRNHFETSPATSNLNPKTVEPNLFSWPAALLGAAVGIAGPAYSGTLFSNVTVWLFLSQSKSIQEAYAYIGRYSITLPMTIGFLMQIGFALGSGWVAAAYGRGASLLQGLAAGLLAASFSLIMFLNPSSSAIPLWFKATSLLVPVVGAVIGAYAFARKA